MRTLLLSMAVLLQAPSTPLRVNASQDKPVPDEKQLYKFGPDSERQEGVPKGTVTKHSWTSKIFEGTVRDYWVYVPAQYDAATPAALMVFQDGAGYVAEKGTYRVPVVFDNLIHKKEMPITVGVFINPGGKSDAKPGDRPFNRSFEYDTMSDQYVRFLVEEILPEVGKTVNLSKDPKDRAIGGASSGGICAWTAAWERPDQFSKVLSHVGSFTNIRGGHNCQALVRKTPKKAIRVFLQDGSNDLDNDYGNWPLANQEMAASLRYAKYDFKLVFGEGKHSGVHGGAILPDSMRWLWRPEGAPAEPEPPKPPAPDEKKLYVLGPDSQRQEGVPKGAVTKQSWTSRVFDGTVRDYWVYVPAQYDAAKPAALMVFQDGGGYAQENGQWRTPVVFDNLIHKKEMPVTIGLFINPGSFPPEREGQKSRSNRSFEYDSLGDQYARFLIEELIPELAKTWALSKDPKDRAICGISSGGICAWTVAWERPGEFSKVLSHVGSFTNIRGGHNYAALIRKTPPKPIRIWFQDGSNDLDNEHGSWPLANQHLATSLKHAKYDHKFVYGEGKHSGTQGAALLPDSLRWLWRAE